MWRDDASILDMLNACRRIQRYMKGMDRAAFLDDEVRQDAIIRQLTILGEAAKRISSECRVTHPEIPWQRIAGFRDVAIHQYDKVILPRVWQVLEEDLGRVADQLSVLVPPEHS